MTETAIESGSHPEGEVLPAETAGDPASPAVAPDQGEKPDPSLTANGEKLDRQTRNWRALERDRDHWREMAMRTQTPQRPEPEPVKAEPQGKNLADFEYDERKYQDYLFKHAEDRAVKAAEQRLREEETRRTRERRTSEFARRESDFAKDLDDYHEVTRAASLPITEAMAEVIGESNEGPALAYYLGKNLSVAESISRLSPIAAARELGRIEERLVAERKATKTPVASKAPPPPPKIEGSGDGSTKVAADSPDSDKLSTSEWMKAREKQLNRKR